MGTQRLEAFTDGVFAIAATLLILRVTADAPGGALGTALRHGWTQYATYVMSFLMIGTWWVNHHAWTALIARADRYLLLANIGFLICVAFLPYPTFLVAQHFHDAGLRAAVIVYGVTLTAASAFASMTWFHAANGRRLIAPDADHALVIRQSRDVRVGVPWCAAATLVALWNPYVSLTLVAVSLVFYMVGGSFLESRERGSHRTGT